MKQVLLLLFTLISAVGYSQYSMQFCVQVSKADSCIKRANEFDITSQGGTISMLVKADDSLGTQELRYKIYFLDNYGNEEFTQTINQKTGTDWTYAWQDVVFYDAGTYKVKVYRVSETEEFICSSLVKIFKQP